MREFESAARLPDPTRVTLEPSHHRTHRRTFAPSYHRTVEAACLGDAAARCFDDDHLMLTDFSNQMADIVSSAAPSIVQVRGRRRPASGVIYGEGTVVTTMRALGREDGLQVRLHDGGLLDAELAGWDPTTTLAALRVPGLTGRGLTPTHTPARVGHIVLAVGRSWSNAVTASAGIIAGLPFPWP